MALVFDMASGNCEDSGKQALGADARIPGPTYLVPAEAAPALQTVAFDTERLSRADKAAIRRHLLAIKHTGD